MDKFKKKKGLGHNISMTFASIPCMQDRPQTIQRRKIRETEPELRAAESPVMHRPDSQIKQTRQSSLNCLVLIKGFMFGDTNYVITLKDRNLLLDMQVPFLEGCGADGAYQTERAAA